MNTYLQAFARTMIATAAIGVALAIVCLLTYLIVDVLTPAGYLWAGIGAGYFALVYWVILRDLRKKEERARRREIDAPL